MDIIQDDINIILDAVGNWLGSLRGMVNDGSIFFRVMLPLYVLMIVGEWAVYMYRHRDEWNGRDAWSNVAISSMNMVFSVVSGVLLPFAVFYYIYSEWRLFTLPETGWGWLLAFLLHDFIYYANHWLSHRTGLLWAFHSVHHSSREFNFTVAARGTFLDEAQQAPFYALMPLLGVSPFQMVVINILTSLFGIFNHTRLVKKMGFFEHILETPSNHRVHHGTNPHYLDRNYGQVLVVWDKLFGTYQREEEEPDYGLITNINTYNPMRVQVAGFRWLWLQMQSADRWPDKLRYLYKPPGWRHDGPGQTAEDIRRAHYKLRSETATCDI
ncbi:sterol desaturase family protein [Spirosoma montaniterrae]|uniref:Fatty acid hydroxylase domain-containing protein n=1 Tax=Spirosoma montaniterrae TaxID=1178516 RepID=A0A1P9WVB1_9BACT|nr:sterol desaturase family protein [Spirosoma montaniterrae]AQG79268.1 hypothetical protein AWR27_07975 [Spirosoma montaniterrae]